MEDSSITDLKEVVKPCELELQDPEQQNLEQQGPEPQHPEPQDPQPQELEPQDLETTCSKCHSNFVMPKILPCGHLFCKDCIVSVIDSQMQPCCPRCNNPFFSPAEKDKNSPVILADSLPTDFVMEELARSADVLAREAVCRVCDDVRAESICLHCRDMLCAACTNAHKKLSMSSSHEVVSLSTVPVKSLAATHPLMCRVHTEKQADFFCSDHSLAVCGLCSVKKHRECSQVRELGEEVESADNALNGMTQVLAQVEEKLQHAIGQLNERLHEVDVSEEEDTKSVEDACEYLLTLVKDFQKKLKDKSHDSHEKVRKSLSDVKNGLVKRSEEVTSHKSIVKRAREVAALPAKIEVSKTLTERINGLDLKVTLDRNVGKDPVTTAKFCEEVVTKVKKELTEEDDPPRTSRDHNPPISPISPWGPWRGHDVAYFEGCVVTSYEPLQPNTLYQIRLDENSKRSHMYYGVSGNDSASGERKGLVFAAWRQVSTEGSVAGLMIDSLNHLHFYLDGEDIGTVTKGIPRPCYALVKFKHQMKVTWLPLDRKFD